jgi:hypothetical protein
MMLEYRGHDSESTITENAVIAAIETTNDLGGTVGPGRRGRRSWRDQRFATAKKEAIVRLSAKESSR